jgi:hypothetical protein
VEEAVKVAVPPWDTVAGEGLGVIAGVPGAETTVKVAAELVAVLGVLELALALVATASNS